MDAVRRQAALVVPRQGVQVAVLGQGEDDLQEEGAMPTVHRCDCCGQNIYKGGWHIVTIEDYEIPEGMAPAAGVRCVCRICMWQIRAAANAIGRKERGLAYSGWEAPRF